MHEPHAGAVVSSVQIRREKKVSRAHEIHIYTCSCHGQPYSSTWSILAATTNPSISGLVKDSSDVETLLTMESCNRYHTVTKATFKSLYSTQHAQQKENIPVWVHSPKDCQSRTRHPLAIHPSHQLATIQSTAEYPSKYHAYHS